MLSERNFYQKYYFEQEYQLTYHWEWARESPEFFSRLDTQVSLDSNIFYWAPTMSVVFKMQFPEIVDRSADANKFATVNKEETSHVLGKLTLDTTQFFPMLTDTVLGDFGRFFVVNRNGAIISSAVLEDQIQIIGQGLYGDKSNLAFKKIWQVEGFQYVTAGHFTTSDTLVDVPGSSYKIVVSPIVDDARYEGIYIVLTSSTEPFRYPTVYFFQVTSIILGIFPYILSLTVVVLYALREKAVMDKIKKREVALEEAKATLGAVNAATKGTG